MKRLLRMTNAVMVTQIGIPKSDTTNVLFFETTLIYFACFTKRDLKKRLPRRR